MRTSIQLSCPTRATFFMYIMALGLLMVSRLRFPSILGYGFYILVHRSQFCPLCWELYPLWAFHLLYILGLWILGPSTGFKLSHRTAWHKEQLRNASFDSRHSAPIGKGLRSPFVTNMHTWMYTHIQTYARREDCRIHRLTKRLKYPKVGEWKKQKNKRTREKVKWKDTKNKEQRTKKHIEQGKKMAQERQKGHTEERNPRWRVETAERRPESEIGKKSN